MQPYSFRSSHKLDEMKSSKFMVDEEKDQTDGRNIHDAKDA